MLRGHQMAPFQSKFQVTKNRTDWECQKTPTSQISASEHVLFSRNKIQKIAYHLYGWTFNFIEKLLSIQMIDNFWDFISGQPNIFGR